MPISPKKICRKPGCQNATRNPTGFCDKCKPKIAEREKAVRKDYDKRRDPNVKSWLGSSRYHKRRRLFLIKNYECSICGKRSNILDHKIPHNGNYDLFWDESNWDAKCETCHNRKTATYDGGFGNVKRVGKLGIGKNRFEEL